LNISFYHKPSQFLFQPAKCDPTHNTYFISDGKIRILRVRKNGVR